MIHCAHTLCFTTEAFNQDYSRLHSMFMQLYYPMGLMNFTINNFILNISSDKEIEKVDDSSVIRISLPFKDQKHLLMQLESKCMISVSRLLCYQFSSARNWNKSWRCQRSSLWLWTGDPLCILFSCDLCDADYSDYVALQLNQCIFKHKTSVTTKYFLDAQGD